MTRELDLTADIIDVRDIIARAEELETDRDGWVHIAEDGTESSGAEDWAQWLSGDAEELAMLNSILADLRGNGGDEQWRGDWYPVTLIRDSYFQRYAEELAEDIGAINPDASWPNNCIDWERAARELQYDYTSTEIDGVTYWYR